MNLTTKVRYTGEFCQTKYSEFLTHSYKVHKGHNNVDISMNLREFSLSRPTTVCSELSDVRFYMCARVTKVVTGTTYDRDVGT